MNEHTGRRTICEPFKIRVVEPLPLPSHERRVQVLRDADHLRAALPAALHGPVRTVELTRIRDDGRGDAVVEQGGAWCGRVSPVQRTTLISH